MCSLLPITYYTQKSNFASSGVHALAHVENTTQRVSRPVWQISRHWLARLHFRAKRVHVNFIICLDKLGHLCAH